MHLPYDYQEFLGQGIKSLVRVGANVTKGTTIFEFDLFKMQLNLKPLYLYVILLNSDSFKRIDVPLRHVEQNTDTLFSLIPTKKK